MAENIKMVKTRKIKVIVLRTAGTNNDYETAHAFKTVGARVNLVHINELFKGEEKLTNFDILAIPGGFSYGDDIAAGKIFANELKYKLYSQIKDFTEKGKLAIGICNGFQVLIKAGLLPGINGIDKAQSTTLTFNDSGKFECRWVHLKRVNSGKCFFTRDLPDKIYLPVAHAEGKFMTKDNGILKTLEENGQIVFKYVDEEGKEAGYPFNPNGSVGDVAAICNSQGNILGMMPHPERFIVPYNHPHWTRREGTSPSPTEDGDGLAIFKNAIKYAMT
ncbi:phosphoribosylformylglycinamidine synthase subunit PurQ [bacterium]|nr:phosphoribosylformylglycinamidine synthase subunit PurQ [bacterium]